MTTVMIDWSACDAFSESTCTCTCGRVFRSHAKCVMVPTPNLVARKACPACGGIALTRASSDPEKMVLGGTKGTPR